MLLAIGLAVGPSVTASAAEGIGCCSPVSMGPVDRTESEGGRSPITSDGQTGTTPDRVASYTGGIAARLRHADGTPVIGDLYLLMATTGSDAPAEVFADTWFTHDRGPHADTSESNVLAVETAEAVTNVDVEQIDFTTAPGGGPSGGLLYLIAYLNQVSGGAFTADVRVAATGQLQDEGYITAVASVGEKLGAARLAGADVFFAPYAPSHLLVAEHAERHVGQGFRSRHGRVSLDVERQLENYEAWGADRPHALDVVVVGHISDVAAYLCGSGSAAACSVAEHLGKWITSDIVTSFDLARAVIDRPDTEIPHGDPSTGSRH